MKSNAERLAVMVAGAVISPGIERTLAMLAQQPPRADILEPFIKGALDVLTQELGSEVVPGKLALANGATTTLDVTVVIGITGKLTGIAVYSMPKELALAMVGRMMGETVTELDEMVLSGIAEMGNV